MILCGPLNAGLYAQNMVQNGDFESFNQCPSGVSGIEYSPNYTQFPTVKNWVRPTINTADYFNFCATNNNVSVPYNSFGYQQARSGQGYAGIWAYATTPINADYREYITTRLTGRMAKDSACVKRGINAV